MIVFKHYKCNIGIRRGGGSTIFNIHQNQRFLKQIFFKETWTVTKLRTLGQLRSRSVARSVTDLRAESKIIISCWIHLCYRSTSLKSFREFSLFNGM